MPNFTYKEAVDYVYRIPSFTKKNTPEDTRRFYEYLGCPGESRAGAPSIIHIAGTNGKGSVCSYISSVLIGAGYKTAMFTSPHLVDIRERFRINGEMMPEEKFVQLVNFCLEKVEKWRSMQTTDASYHPTYFEILFFIGMLWFEEQQADVIVLETGLGGRLDATNVIRHPAVSVITKVGLDHMEYLGNTKAEIAGEKAGIIKPGVPVVYWDGEADVSAVICKKAAEMGAKAVPVSKSHVASYKFKNKTVDFSLDSEYYEYVKICLHTAAVYQRENAALAVRALEILSQRFQLSREQIESGLAAARWEGRMEEVLPNVFIDGAHNEDGVNSFLESVSADGCRGKRLLLFSVVSDKQFERMAEKILDSGLFSEIAVAQLEGSRALPEKQLVDLWRGKAAAFLSPEAAFEQLIRQKGAEDKVYAAGSLYLAGQLLAWSRDKR